MYSGARWVESSYKVKLSPLGKDVSNLLGRVFMGIYHLSPKALSRVQWDDEYCIEYIHDRDMATFDFNDLTALVVYAHDGMLRISISGCGPRYMKLQFHKRHKREGGISERMPTIEKHIEGLRARETAE